MIIIDPEYERQKRAERAISLIATGILAVMVVLAVWFFSEVAL